jgi:hypothetical protein
MDELGAEANLSRTAIHGRTGGLAGRRAGMGAGARGPGHQRSHPTSPTSRGTTAAI